MAQNEEEIIIIINGPRPKSGGHSAHASKLGQGVTLDYIEGESTADTLRRAADQVEEE